MKEAIHSKMTFYYDENDCFEIETSNLKKSIESVKTVEFILYRREKCALSFIEAKSSFSNPNPSEPPKEGKGFDANIKDICEKFTHSANLFFATMLGRQNSNEIPSALKNLPLNTIKIKLLLVIKGHTEEGCNVIEGELKNCMKTYLKTWKLEISALNDTTALKYGLIKAEKEAKELIKV